MSENSFDIGSFFSCLYFYDRSLGTNFYEFTKSFSKSDNTEFKKMYGYYPVEGKSLGSLFHIRDFIAYKSPGHFKIFEFVPDPDFTIDIDKAIELMKPENIRAEIDDTNLF